MLPRFSIEVWPFLFVFFKKGKLKSKEKLELQICLHFKILNWIKKSYLKKGNLSKKYICIKGKKSFEIGLERRVIWKREI